MAKFFQTSLGKALTVAATTFAGVFLSQVAASSTHLTSATAHDWSTWASSALSAGVAVVAAYFSTDYTGFGKK